MTKVYDALRQADAQRLQRSDSEAAATVAHIETASAARESSGDAPASTGSEMEQLRQLIFGNVLSGYEKEVARVETRIAMEASKIRTEIGELGRRLESRIAEIDLRATKGHSELSGQITSQAAMLRTAVDERSEKTLGIVEKSLQEIRDQKVDRGAFASFLSNLGQHLDVETKQSEAPAKN